MSLIENLKLIWTGKADKSSFIKYVLFWFMIYGIGAIISALFYSEPYSLMKFDISYLGSPAIDRNPNGFWIYNLTVMITGFMEIPQYVYLYKQLRDSAKLWTWFCCFLGIIGYIGFALIGIANQDGPLDPYHRIATILAFGGLGAPVFLLIPVFIRRIRKKFPTGYDLKAFLIMYTTVFVFGGITGIFLGFYQFEETEALTLYPNVNPLWFDRHIWEWIALFIIMAWLFLSVALIKPKSESQK